MKKTIRSLIPHQDGKSFWVPLTQGKFARIDKEDAERVGQCNWCACKKGKKENPVWYARARPNGHKKSIEMQRFLWAPYANLEGMEVDHLNFDTLDNRMDNLQVSAPQRNTYRTRARVQSGQCVGGDWPKIKLKAEPQPVFTTPLPPPRVVDVPSPSKLAFNRRILERLDAAIARNSLPYDKRTPHPHPALNEGGAV